MTRVIRSIVLTASLGVAHPGSGVAAQAAADSAPRLTLAEVFRALDSGNAGLEAARQMATAAGARVRPARTLPDPQIQIGLMNRNLPGLGLQDPLGMTQVQVMQMVPIAGQLGLAGRAAEARAGAARARTAEMRGVLRARAAMAFYEVYQLDRTIEVSLATQGLLRDIAATARTLYSVGQGRQADVLRAQVEIERMSEEIVRMRAMRGAAAARLNGLLDRPAGSAVASPVLPRFPREMPGLDSLARPILAAATLDAAAATAEEQKARREIWPDLQLGAQYGQRPMAGGTDRMLSLMFGFSVPVWAGRRQGEMRRETAAMRLAAEAELRALTAETRGRVGELTATLGRVRTLRDLYAHTILPQAEATVSSALSAYQAGDVDLPTLLDARMTVNRYRQQLFQLDAEEGTALAELELLTGRVLLDPAELATPVPRGES